MASLTGVLASAGGQQTAELVQRPAASTAAAGPSGDPSQQYPSIAQEQQEPDAKESHSHRILTGGNDMLLSMKSLNACRRCGCTCGIAEQRRDLSAAVIDMSPVLFKALISCFTCRCRYSQSHRGHWFVSGMGYPEDSRAERKVEGADKACKGDHGTSAYKGDAVAPVQLSRGCLMGTQVQTWHIQH